MNVEKIVMDYCLPARGLDFIEKQVAWKKG